MIKVIELKKKFGIIPAINGLSFEVDQGEIVGFLGPNGAGKTTTMRILSCFFPPTSGQAFVAGYDVVKNSLKVRSKVGYFIEKAPLYTDMTVSGFLDFAADARLLTKNEKKLKIGRSMEECGINNVSKKLIKNLSRGYRQRVAMAQVLLHDPEVLILDEPTIGLDPEQVVEIRKLIKGMDSKRTVLLSTHILHDVSTICNRIIIIDKGKIIAEDTPENLTNKLRKTYSIYVKVDGPRDKIIHELKKIHGVISVDIKENISNNISSYVIESKNEKDLSIKISRTIFDNNWGLIEIKPVLMSLEDIFLKVLNKNKKDSVNNTISSNAATLG